MSSRRLLQVLSQRNFTSTSARRADEIAKGYDKLYAKQKLFQQDNDLPVHVKGGVADTILYKFTIGLCVVGCGTGFKLLYDLSFPSV